MKGLNLRQAKSVLIFFVLLGFWGISTAPLLAQGNGEDIETRQRNFETELSRPKEFEYVPGEIIVKLKEGKTLQDIQELNIKYNVTSTEKVFKETPSPEDTLKQLKDKLASLGTEHDKWYWQTDKNSQEYKDYIARIEKEKEQLQRQIDAQEKLIERLEQRQKRAPENVTLPNLTNIYLLKTAKDTNIIFMSQEYKANENVEYAEPNYIAKEDALPNDPYFASSNSWGQGYDDLWGLKKIQADKAWDISQGEGVIVAVVDYGIDYNHPDIAANIWRNKGEIPDNGIDDDHNDYPDDDKGWDFVNGDNDPIDENGHGTHVAGTIAAIGNNNIGIIGVAPKARVMAVKGLGYKEGKDSSTVLANCIMYAARNGADVINNSWGVNLNNTLADAIKEAHGMGCVLVFSTGNMNTDFFNNSLKSRPEIINVASTDHNDKKSDFSNWGFKVDVAAPGGDSGKDYNLADNILSLKAHGTSGVGYALGTDYIRKSGTSMACPHVSGVAALLLSSNLDLKRKNEEIRQILRVSSDDAEEAGFDVKTGFGRVNAYKALNMKQALEVRITNPSALTVDALTSLIPITGIADGKYFSSYELFYARLDTLSSANNLNWSSATGIKYYPISNGVIGTLNVKNLTTGLYALRLQAKDIFGMQFEDYLPVSVEKNPLRMIAVENWYPGLSVLGLVISGNRIFWSSPRNAKPESPNLAERQNLDVYLYDLAENKERQITSGLGQEYSAGIYGDYIVYGAWEDYDTNNGAGRHNIYLYDLSTGSQEKIAEGIGPAISGSKIAWIDLNGSIHIYDLSLKKELPIIAAKKAVSLAISENYVAWLENSFEKVYVDNIVTVYSTYTIYCYNLTNGNKIQVTSSEKYTDKSTPVVSGNRIVWSEEYDSNYDIYLYDLTTDTKSRLTIDPAEQKNPAISGDYVVWQDKRNGNWDIYLYDLKTNTEQQITANIPPQYHPAISEGRVVWVDERNSRPDIYMTAIEDKIPPGITHTPFTGPIYPSRYRPIEFTAVVSDAESGVTDAAVYWSRLTRVQFRGRWGIKMWEWRWNNFYKLPMVKTGNNIYKASLSSLALRNSSVRYFISAKDKAGNSASTKTYVIR